MTVTMTDVDLLPVVETYTDPDIGKPCQVRTRDCNKLAEWRFFVRCTACDVTAIRLACNHHKDSWLWLLDGKLLPTHAYPKNLECQGRMLVVYVEAIK